MMSILRSFLDWGDDIFSILKLTLHIAIIRTWRPSHSPRYQACNKEISGVKAKRSQLRFQRSPVDANGHNF